MPRLIQTSVLFVLTFLVSIVSPLAEPSPESVITLRPQSSEDSRYDYAQSLLEKVLQKAGSTAPVAQARIHFSRDRLLQELIKGDNIHVIAEAPKPGWEDKLLPIHIPLRKGIQGYRLFLINKQDQEALATVDTLEELQTYPTGSGAQWSTRHVMERAGFQVVTSADYDDLFKMLKLRRFITFGRGVNEAFKELESFAHQNEHLAVEESLCVFVLLPTYFFVSPTRPELARQIETGLKRMIADGSFDQHFRLFHQADIARANLANRKIFVISNPNLSRHTPFNNPSYWLNPDLAATAGKGIGS
ncbi:MAG: hypothetical protein K5905_04400 [Roseibium sp.]|uniref:hypothetical protein n=1 Tax=Roseibium sp. TaxID=1936156 RepID=UPI002625907A|nr:hypothetical protein [Roseibium sp.]MCV0424689.1 hypothetical protein [Roseibium sp.]